MLTPIYSRVIDFEVVPTLNYHPLMITWVVNALIKIFYEGILAFLNFGDGANYTNVLLV